MMAKEREWTKPKGTVSGRNGIHPSEREKGMEGSLICLQTASISLFPTGQHLPYLGIPLHKI